MPALADYLTDESLRSHTVWRLLTQLPSTVSDAAALQALGCGMADQQWTGSNLSVEALGSLSRIGIDVRTDPIVSGGSPAFAAMLVYPGDPDTIVCFIELRGGYSLGADDYLTFRLDAVLPND